MNNYEIAVPSEVTMREHTYIREINVEELDKPYEIRNITETRMLSDEQRMEIMKETSYSDSITEAIGSMEEYHIYKEAGLMEARVGEKICLVRPDIDMKQVDGFGRTNKERMEQGLAPLTPEGRPYELHHIGQHQSSPLAELTMQEHRGRGNDTVLHIKTKESEIDREKFGFERAEHWQNRAKELEE